MDCDRIKKQKLSGETKVARMLDLADRLNETIINML